MKNRNLAILEEAVATPLKPNKPAMMATIKNIMAHVSIVSKVLVEHSVCALHTLLVSKIQTKQQTMCMWLKGQLVSQSLFKLRNPLSEIELLQALKPDRENTNHFF